MAELNRRRRRSIDHRLVNRGPENGMKTDGIDDNDQASKNLVAPTGFFHDSCSQRRHVPAANNKDVAAAALGSNSADKRGGYKEDSLLRRMRESLGAPQMLPQQKVPANPSSSSIFLKSSTAGPSTTDIGRSEAVLGQKNGAAPSAVVESSEKSHEYDSARIRTVEHQVSELQSRRIGTTSVCSTEAYMREGQQEESHQPHQYHLNPTAARVSSVSEAVAAASGQLRRTASWTSIASTASASSTIITWAMPAPEAGAATRISSRRTSSNSVDSINTWTTEWSSHDDADENTRRTSIRRSLLVNTLFTLVQDNEESEERSNESSHLLELDNAQHYGGLQPTTF